MSGQNQQRLRRMAGRQGLRSPSRALRVSHRSTGVRFNDGRFRVTTQGAAPSTCARFVFTGHRPLEAWVHYRGEPSVLPSLPCARAGSPWPEQIDRKMLRFVEKRGVRTHKRKRLQRGDILICIHWPLITILSPHDLRGPPSMPALIWVQHSSLGRRQHASKCYVFRLFPKFGTLVFVVNFYSVLSYVDSCRDAGETRL